MILPNNEFVTVIVELDELISIPKSRYVKERKFLKVVKTNYRTDRWIEAFG